MDFKNEEELNKLKYSEIAELLFFAHLVKPMNQVNLYEIIDRFAYFTHDDGWFNKLYVKNTEEYEELLSKCVVQKLRDFTNRTIADNTSIICDAVFVL